MIAALFVETNGCYFGHEGVDPWDEARDARLYADPYPVVVHPPCQLWGRFAKVNFIRWGGEHNRPGNDGGCFVSALASVRQYGGVLEHPAFIAGRTSRQNFTGSVQTALIKSDSMTSAARHATSPP